MIDRINNLLKNDWIFNILFIFLGMFIENIWQRLRILNRRLIGRKKKEDFIRALDRDLGITTLAYGYPSFARVDIIAGKETFLLHFGYFTDYDLEYLDRHINWTDILKSYAISHEELNTIIKESKNDIYHQFENHLDGKHFNGEMFGISSLDQFYRTNDRYESPGINIVTYSTDYFTMNSMAEILKRLRARRPEVRMEIGGLSYFRNSIGVNVLLILPSTNEIVMVKRSKHSSYTEEKRLIYPSTVETLSIADETSKINIDLCVYRGIEEELGLTIDELDTKSLINYAMFFENNYFQDNFVLSISADESITLQNIRDRLAKDRMLEIEEIDSIPNNKRAIDRYIARNKNNMQFQTIYCLEIYKKMTF